MGNGDKGERARDALGLIGAIRSPLGFLALAALICDGVFAITGALKGDRDTIIFAMHMFLGIVGAVVLTAIWSPASLYHPADLKDCKPSDLVDRTGRWVITGVLLLVILVYMAYRIAVDVHFRIGY